MNFQSLNARHVVQLISIKYRPLKRWQARLVLAYSVKPLVANTNVWTVNTSGNITRRLYYG